MIESVDLRSDIETDDVVEPVVTYDAEVRPEVVAGDLIYVANHPQLRGCMSDGATPEEALANLAGARQDYLAALRAHGLPVPPQPLHPIVSVIIASYSVRKPDHPQQTPWEQVLVADPRRP
jgi:predicted RNase H-like HicB family nuclease